MLRVRIEISSVVPMKNSTRKFDLAYFQERLTLDFMQRLALFLRDQMYYLPGHIKRELLLKFKGETDGVYLVCNIARWKRIIVANMLWREHARSVRFVPLDVELSKVDELLEGKSDPVFVIWGVPKKEILTDYAARHDIPLWRLEDGFIRSVGLGAKHIPPASLILDKTGGIYFNSQVRSSLEDFLGEHRFTEQEKSFSKSVIAKVLKNRITKYNLRETGDNYQVNPDQTNIMVFGQCEDDASILYGSPEIKLNTRLIEKALEENPDANIYFRPHPDVTAGLRKALSDIYLYKDRVCIMDQPYPVWENIQLFKRIYVMTSLAGFEAILRGCDVRVFGLPFYAGWGLSDDYLQCERRNRNLQVEEVFYGAYLHVPTYIDPRTGKASDVEKAIRFLLK